MTDRTPMQRALERDTEIEDLARENEMLREALGAVRDLRDEICDLIEDGATIDAPHAVAVKIGNVIDTALGKDRT